MCIYIYICVYIYIYTSIAYSYTITCTPVGTSTNLRDTLWDLAALQPRRLLRWIHPWALALEALSAVRGGPMVDQWWKTSNHLKSLSYF